MKFFVREKKCSVCGKIIGDEKIKKARKFGSIYTFCESCWNEAYEKYKPKVLDYVKEKEKNKEKIGVKDTQNLMKDLIK